MALCSCSEETASGRKCLPIGKLYSMPICVESLIGKNLTHSQVPERGIDEVGAMALQLARGFDTVGRTMHLRLMTLLAAAGCLLPAAALADKLPSAFDGYVTNIASANEFDVGQRHVLCSPQTKWGHAKHLPNSLAVLRVGAQVYVKGEGHQGAFVAKSV